MLIWLVFSNIVHPRYFPVILRTDVRCNLMEHHGRLKQTLRIHYMFATYLQIKYSDTLGLIKFYLFERIVEIKRWTNWKWFVKPYIWEGDRLSKPVWCMNVVHIFDKLCANLYILVFTILSFFFFSCCNIQISPDGDWVPVCLYLGRPRFSPAHIIPWFVLQRGHFRSHLDVSTGGFSCFENITSSYGENVFWHFVDMTLSLAAFSSVRLLAPDNFHLCCELTDRVSHLAVICPDRDGEVHDYRLHMYSSSPNLPMTLTLRLSWSELPSDLES